MASDPPSTATSSTATSSNTPPSSIGTLASNPVDASLTAAMRHRIPLRLWQSLDPEQRNLMLGAFQTQQTRHAIDYRVSIDTIFWGRFYLTVFAGTERRNRDRLTAEGQTALPRQAGLLISLAIMLMTYAAFGLFAFAYLLKSALGIDLSDEASWLHPLYELFRGP